jgi:hypothetical protein
MNTTCPPKHFLRLIFLPGIAFAVSVSAAPPDVAQQGAHWMSLLSPSARQKVEAAAQEAAPLMTRKQTEARLAGQVRPIAQRYFPTLSGNDILAVMMLVMIEASQQTREDLKMQMEKVKAQNKAKQKYPRSALQASPQPDVAARERSLTGDARRQSTVSTKDQFDSLGDVSTEKQQRLQMYMDNYNQTAAIIANVLKKSSATSDSIIGNLK